MTSNAFMAQLPESWKRQLFISGRGAFRRAEAKTILVEGVLAEVMEEFGLGELFGAFRARISSWMEA